MRRLLSTVRTWSVAVAATLFVVAAWAPAVQALDIPPAPTDIPVVDQTNTLTQEQKQSLAARIAEERTSTGNQIAILMIASLEGQAIEDYSLQVARGWGVGQKDRDSGVLLLIAKDDRRLRIEVGYGLEGALTDARSGRIIRDRITPKFREGKYYDGINEGLSGIITAIHGEADPNLKPDGEGAGSGNPSGFPFEMIIWGIVIIPIWLSSVLARTKSWWAGGVIGGVLGVIAAFFIASLIISMILTVGLVIFGLLFDRAVSRNYRKHAGGHEPPSWWAGGPWIGGGGSGGGDGGFGGFGGGSFGGGGSSGSW